MQQEPAFQEALIAIQQGQKERGRELLTRLIKIDSAQARYWLWMSTVVDTEKERLFCLKETLKRDPNNNTARRGLILMGELPPDPSLAVPAQLQQRNWEAGFFDNLSQVAKPKMPLGIILGVGAVLILIAGIILANLNHVEIPAFVAWIQRYTPAPTSVNSPIFLNTATPEPLVKPSGTPSNMGLLTATPTALYVNTPHPRTESYRAAIAAFQKGDFSTTVHDLLQVLKEDPKVDIYYLLGESYRLQNKTKDAAQAYDLAILQDPKFAPAYLGRARLRQVATPEQTQQVRADLEKAISLDPKLVEAYLELAKFKIANKEAKSALADLESARLLAPVSPMPYYYRAQAYLALNQPDKAVADARQASQIDPASLPAYHLLAEVQRANANMSASIPPLETYTQYARDDVEALAWLGQAYAAGGDMTRGLRLLDQAVTLDNQSFEAHLMRGLVYIEMADGSKALEDLRQANTLRPAVFAVSLGIGRAALVNKDGSEAWRSFSSALIQAKTDTEKAQAYYWRAQALELNKQVLQAIADWNELLRLPASSHDRAAARCRPISPAGALHCHPNHGRADRHADPQTHRDPPACSHHYTHQHGSTRLSFPTLCARCPFTCCSSSANSARRAIAAGPCSISSGPGWRLDSC